MQHLKPNTTLQVGRYKIIKTLGQGGFGITYLALQSGLERQVAVKEFFMKDCCERDESARHVTLGTSGAREQVGRFREKFLKEACNIARLNHPNIVRIIDVFEENGTAYYVMEYAEGGSLADKVTVQGHLSETAAARYIKQVAEALDYLHQRKMNHLDVKPGNIMLNENDEAVLIDFGLAKQYDAVTGGQTSTTPVGISEGYAPTEQYKQGGVGEFAPEADIYALGATFFKLLTGATPPSALDVMEDGVPTDELEKNKVSAEIIALITHAMESRKKDRIHSAAEFLKGLKGGGAAAEPMVQNEDDTVFVHVDDSDRTITADHKEPKATQRPVTDKPKVPQRPVDEKPQTPTSLEPQSPTSLREGNRRPRKVLYAVIAVVVIGAGIASWGVMSKNGAQQDVTATELQQEVPKSQQEISHTKFTVNGVSFEMAKVEGDTFNMGGTLRHNYYIGKTEVTQKLWKRVMGSNPSYSKGNNKPVERVSWNDCQEFISKLNAATGKNFRLPTEAEWEFAARGGNNSNHYQYSGSNNLNEVAWYASNSNMKTHDVAVKRPNELGIYDMNGNVWEWCFDSDGTNRVRRGGSFSRDTTCCSPSIRFSRAPTRRFYDLGFRLALSE